MEEKIKIKFVNKIEEVKVKLFNSEIKIKTVIPFEEIQTIQYDILENILHNSDIVDKYLMMKLRFRQDIIALCTNIDIEGMNEDDIMNLTLSNMLYENIVNLYDAEECINKIYEEWVFKNSLGLLVNATPSTEEMESVVNKLTELINGIPEEKLKMISDTIAWNSAPLLKNKNSKGLN